MSHLSGLHDVDTVAAEKGKLFEKTASQGTLFVNLADRKVADLAKENPRQKVNFSLQKTAEAKVFFVHSKSLGMGGWETVVSAKGQEYKLKIPHVGRPMLKNSLAAIAVGNHLGVPMPQIEMGLAQKIFKSGRGEILSLPGQRMLIDDSYNSNPLSMRAAIENLCALAKEKKKLVIVGDMLEQGEDSEKLHRQVGAFLKLKKIDAVIAIGEFASAIDEGFAESGEIAHFRSLEDAENTSTQWAFDAQWILVKGSRGMQMEKIVNLLTRGQVH
jgi:UDP-N-acetylmuramoyl-tripeptide--D-alanyl-D-alanine ligase